MNSLLYAPNQRDLAVSGSGETCRPFSLLDAQPDRQKVKAPLIQIPGNGRERKVLHKPEGSFKYSESLLSAERRAAENAAKSRLPGPKTKEQNAKGRGRDEDGGQSSGRSLIPALRQSRTCQPDEGGARLGVLPLVTAGPASHLSTSSTDSDQIKSPPPPPPPNSGRFGFVCLPVTQRTPLELG